MPTKEMKKNIIGGIDLETKIYRTFSLTRFIDAFTTDTNTLVRTKLWEDPFENFFLSGGAITDKGEPVCTASLRNEWYGQCWTTNSDSDAMWRIYSPDKLGVKVETTVGGLFGALYEKNDVYSHLKYLIGVVEYQSKEDIENFLANTRFMDLAMGGQSHALAKTLLMKRKAFDHEQEVRLLFRDSGDEFINNDVATFPTDWKSIITEAALDPRATEQEYFDLTNELIRAGLSANQITQSDLYKFTPVRIAL